MSNKTIALAVAAALLAGTAHAQGISGDVVKIGIMNGASGPYAAISGKGSVVAAQMAVEDFGGKVLGKPVQILSADHQNKPDIGSAVAREWIDREGVDMIADMDTSSVALAVQRLATDKGVLTINTGAGSTALTNEQCTPLGIHYAYDTYALAVGTANPIIQPSANAGPLARPRPDVSMSITLTMGKGLIATPSAGVRISPIATPMVSSNDAYLHAGDR